MLGARLVVIFGVCWCGTCLLDVCYVLRWLFILTVSCLWFTLCCGLLVETALLVCLLAGLILFEFAVAVGDCLGYKLVLCALGFGGFGCTQCLVLIGAWFWVDSGWLCLGVILVWCVPFGDLWVCVFWIMVEVFVGRSAFGFVPVGFWVRGGLI